MTVIMIFIEMLSSEKSNHDCEEFIAQNGLMSRLGTSSLQIFLYHMSSTSWNGEIFIVSGYT